jgi:hypothetical protein
MKANNQRFVWVSLSLLLLGCTGNERGDEEEEKMPGPVSDLMPIDTEYETPEPFDDTEKPSVNLSPCGDCPLNSGYPCPCEDRCEDGGICGKTDINQKYGICVKPCDDGESCEISMGCWARGTCGLKMATGTEAFCVLTCVVDSDCPLNMDCDFTIGFGMCVHQRSFSDAGPLDSGPDAS